MQDERRRLTNEIFDLFDRGNKGYIDCKEALRLLVSIGRKLDPEEENEFLTIVDPRNTGRVPKENFLAGIEMMFTVPNEYLHDIHEAFKFFDKDNDGKISCKEFKQMLVRLSGEYTDKDVDELFKIVDLDLDGFININEFIHVWKFQ